MTTPAAGSPVIPSALDQAVATDAAALSAAPSELQLLIGSLENLAAGVIPGLAAAGAAAVSPALSPEAAAAAALLAAELRSLPAAQAADANATAVAGVGLVQQAIAPALAKLPVLALLCLLGDAAWCDDAPIRAESSLSWIAHLQAVLLTALPWIITGLGVLLALGKTVQPALARRSPAIGNAIALFDHVVDGIYWLLTSRAGLAEDAESEAHTQALTGLLSKLNQAAANPIVGAAIATAVAQLPAASQDAIKAVQADMPVFLQAIQTATIQAPSAPGAPVKAVPAAPGAPSSTTAPPAP